MNSEPIDIDRLAESIVQKLAPLLAKHLDPAVLLTAPEVAELLGCAARSFAERIAREPGFPAPVRIGGPPGRHTGRPRWQRADILDWLKQRKTPRGKVGRPRKSVEW